MNNHLLIRRKIPHDLVGLLVGRDIWMRSIEHCLDVKHNHKVKKRVSSQVSIQCSLRIINVELSIDRSCSITVWKKSTHMIIDAAMHREDLGTTTSMKVVIELDSS
jgi:hypothetical protein